MSNTIYLYLKTHNVTGLKYLGKTIRDPFDYQGSGTRWTNHIKKHGYDVTTEILFKTTDKEEFKKVGLEYSRKWNIVESKEFANLMEEQGEGGDTFSGKTHTFETRAKIATKLKGHTISEETRKKRSDSLKGRIISEETRKKLSDALKGRKVTCPTKHSEEFKQHMSELRKTHNPGFKNKSTCPHCGKEGQNAIMQRWHFDNCKEKK